MRNKKESINAFGKTQNLVLLFVNKQVTIFYQWNR